METVGIINGCLDAEVQIPFYPETAYNNTYGVQIINETVYKKAVESWPQCQQLIHQCKALEAQKDPQNTGTNNETNTACATAFATCFKTMHDPYNQLLVSLNEMMISMQMRKEHRPLIQRHSTTYLTSRLLLSAPSLPSTPPAT